MHADELIIMLYQKDKVASSGKNEQSPEWLDQERMQLVNEHGNE